MTQEEIEAYAQRMLAASGLPNSLEGIEPGAKLQLQSLRVNIVCQVIAACGRPIAKAEQEMIAKATAQIGRRGVDIKEGPWPVRDGAFNPGDGSIE